MNSSVSTSPVSTSPAELSVVKATTGRDLGTRPSRRMRDEGKLPGVVYGRGTEPKAVHVEYAELREVLQGEAGLNTIFTLDVEGVAETVIVREIQRDPIKRRVTHADFMRVEMDTPITVTVPVELTGVAVKVADAGALVEQKLFSVKVRATPRTIPTAIRADISKLTLDSRLAIGDLKLPEGVTTLANDRITVAAPVGTRASRMGANELGEDEELSDEVAEDEEIAEGEAGESAEAGDAAEAASSDE